MDIMVAYTDFDRPFATSPGVPQDRLKIIRDAFEKALADSNFSGEAKKLLDWDTSSYLTGVELQKRIEKIVTQPPEVIKRIKEILREAG
jgi:tripartite-type tricarboxylate transporter receptor subunit TctC